MNFIPAHRLEARRRRSVRRWCVAACVAYAAVAGAGTAVALVCSGRGVEDLTQQLESAAQENDSIGRELSRVQSELTVSDALLRSSRSIAEQPDWSQLLSLLAQLSGKSVRLRSLTVFPRSASPAQSSPLPVAKGAKPTPIDTALLVNISGLASSQEAVSTLALRLEGVGLFDRVTLVETGREAVEGLPLTGFRLECVLAEPEGVLTRPNRTATASTVVGERP